MKPLITKNVYRWQLTYMTIYLVRPLVRTFLFWEDAVEELRKAYRVGLVERTMNEPLQNLQQLTAATPPLWSRMDENRARVEAMPDWKKGTPCKSIPPQD